MPARAREHDAGLDLYAAEAVTIEPGARVLIVPTIAIEPPVSWEPLDGALATLDDYQWAVFTSVNGVEMTRRRLAETGRGAEALRGRRLAAIGPATAKALHAMGLEAEVVPELVSLVRESIGPVAVAPSAGSVMHTVME